MFRRCWLKTSMLSCCLAMLESVNDPEQPKQMRDFFELHNLFNAMASNGVLLGIVEQSSHRGHLVGKRRTMTHPSHEAQRGAVDGTQHGAGYDTMAQGVDSMRGGWVGTNRGGGGEFGTVRGGLNVSHDSLHINDSIRIDDATAHSAGGRMASFEAGPNRKSLPTFDLDENGVFPAKISTAAGLSFEAQKRSSVSGERQHITDFLHKTQVRIRHGFRLFSSLAAAAAAPLRPASSHLGV